MQLLVFHQVAHQLHVSGYLGSTHRKRERLVCGAQRELQLKNLGVTLALDWRTAVHASRVKAK